ncbi:hypothetical protein, partial [Kosakonia quasisacchari]|uniref:hypothetical protein n=1 Tax=Kosakonia quasisacchari TaxID=2529380 RepID=UPI001ABADBF7
GDGDDSLSEGKARITLISYRLRLPTWHYVQSLNNPNVAPTHTREMLRDEHIEAMRHHFTKQS